MMTNKNRMPRHPVFYAEKGHGTEFHALLCIERSGFNADTDDGDADFCFGTDEEPRVVVNAKQCVFAFQYGEIVTS